MNETLTFCSKYLKGVETRFNISERNLDLTEYSGRDKLSVFSSIGRPIGKVSTVRLGEKHRKVVEWYILNNCEEVQPYLA